MKRGRKIVQRMKSIDPHHIGLIRNDLKSCENIDQVYNTIYKSFNEPNQNISDAIKEKVVMRFLQDHPHVLLDANLQK